MNKLSMYMIFALSSGCIQADAEITRHSLQDYKNKFQQCLEEKNIRSQYLCVSMVLRYSKEELEVIKQEFLAKNRLNNQSSVDDNIVEDQQTFNQPSLDDDSRGLLYYIYQLFNNSSNSAKEQKPVHQDEIDAWMKFIDTVDLKDKELSEASRLDGEAFLLKCEKENKKRFWNTKN